MSIKCYQWRLDFRTCLHLDAKKCFLQLVLNVSRDAFNQVRGIRPFRIENLFARVFRPTFVLFVFEIKNTVCLVVKIWSKFKLIQSNDMSFVKPVKLKCQLISHYWLEHCSIVYFMGISKREHTVRVEHASFNSCGRDTVQFLFQFSF